MLTFATCGIRAAQEPDRYLLCTDKEYCRTKASLLTQNNFKPGIDKQMPIRLWDEITYLFPNFNGHSVDVWERISNFTPAF